MPEQCLTLDRRRAILALSKFSQGSTEELRTVTQEYTSYLAEKFLKEYRIYAVEKRLAFDAWADRQGLRADVKRRLWQEVKSMSRRQMV